MSDVDGIITRSRAHSQPNLFSAAFSIVKPKKKAEVPKEKSLTTVGQSLDYSDLGQEATTMEPCSSDVNLLNVENIHEVTPEQWFIMFKSLNGTLISLQQQLSELKSGKFDHFTKEWKEAVDRGTMITDQKLEYQDFEIRLLKNIVIRQEQQIQLLQSRQSAAYQRELKPNMLINGILPVEEENREVLIKAVQTFFKEVMKIEQVIQIEDAYRIGKGNPQTVLIKLQYYADKALIYTNSSHLKGKTNEKKKPYFIKDDTTEEQDEVRKYYHGLVKENEEQPDEAKKFTTVKINKGKIFVNNSAIKQKVHAPTSAGVLRKSEQEYEKVKSFKLIRGLEHEEKQLEFFSYAFKAKTVDEVRKAYDKIKIKYADGTHISCAYRLDDPFGPYRQEYIDDGDFGIGREILNVLKTKKVTQAGVFIIRHFGGTHLGARHFTIAETLANGAVRALRQWSKKQKQRIVRVNSQDSLASIESVISQADLQEAQEEEVSDGST